MPKWMVVMCGVLVCVATSALTGWALAADALIIGLLAGAATVAVLAYGIHWLYPEELPLPTVRRTRRSRSETRGGSPYGSVQPGRRVGPG